MAMWEENDWKGRKREGAEQRGRERDDLLLSSLTEKTWISLTIQLMQRWRTAKVQQWKGKPLCRALKTHLQPQVNWRYCAKLPQRGQHINTVLLQMTERRQKHSFTTHRPTHPLGELRVHHEVVYVLLGLGQLQLPGYHGNHQSRTACTLWETREEEEDTTEHWVSH